MYRKSGEATSKLSKLIETENELCIKIENELVNCFSITQLLLDCKNDIKCYMKKICKGRNVLMPMKFRTHANYYFDLL